MFGTREHINGYCPTCQTQIPCMFEKGLLGGSVFMDVTECPLKRISSEMQAKVTNLFKGQLDTDINLEAMRTYYHGLLYQHALSSNRVFDVKHIPVVLLERDIQPGKINIRFEFVKEEK